MSDCSKLKKYGRNAPLTKELRERIDKTYNERIPRKLPEAFSLNFPLRDCTLPQWVAYATRIHLQKVRGRISELKKNQERSPDRRHHIPLQRKDVRKQPSL